MKKIMLHWKIKMVDCDSGIGLDTCLALDKFGRPHIAYFNPYQHIMKYSWLNNCTWSTQIIGDGSVGDYPFVVLDDKNNPHICFSCRDKWIGYAHKTTSEWIIERIPETEDANMKPVIVLDLNGNPYVCYYDFGVEELRLARKEHGIWFRETVDKVGCGEGTCGFSAMFDANNRLKLAYYEGDNHDLKYACRSDDGWITEIVDSKTDIWHNISLALDTRGNPHISYQDDANTNLMHAHFADGEWKTQIVDSAGDVGFHSSLALMNNDRPCISYYANRILRYAQYDGASWRRGKVDDSVDIYSSLAIDDSDIPHIAYIDESNKCLKYASLILQTV